VNSNSGLDLFSDMKQKVVYLQDNIQYIAEGEVELYSDARHRYNSYEKKITDDIFQTGIYETDGSLIQNQRAELGSVLPKSDSNMSGYFDPNLIEDDAIIRDYAQQSTISRSHTEDGTLHRKRYTEAKRKRIGINTDSKMIREHSLQFARRRNLSKTDCSGHNQDVGVEGDITNKSVDNSVEPLNETFQSFTTTNYFHESLKIKDDVSDLLPPSSFDTDSSSNIPSLCGTQPSYDSHSSQVGISDNSCQLSSQISSKIIHTPVEELGMESKRKRGVMKKIRYLFHLIPSHKNKAIKHNKRFFEDKW